MKSWKWKILFPIILITLLVITKFIVWDFPISTGKRVGNLTKISHKGRFFSTWEGTIDEGSGDKLTSYFSVRSNGIGKELYDYEGRQVIVYYEQYLVGWPWDTNYNVVSWKPRELSQHSSSNSMTSSHESAAVSLLSKTLFCSLLGALYEDQDLYQNVKTHLKKNNLFLFNKIQECNQ